jgi:hypothetical protein
MDRSGYPTRKRHLLEPADDDVSDLSPGERLELVWQLTLQAWAFKEKSEVEQRLRRDVVCVIRGRR